MNKFRNSVDLVRRMNRLRQFSTTAVRAGGGHHDEERPKATWLLPAEDERFYRGYAYREFMNLQGERVTQKARYTLVLIWCFLFYSAWKKPDDFFGHGEYQDTSKWTDEELGIPPDDVE
jgi:hypothetical protein